MNFKDLQIKTILSYYWQPAKEYKLSIFFVFLFYGISTALSSIISPIVYKNIIDLMTQSTDKEAILSKLFALFFILIFNIALIQLFFRIGDYLIASSQSKILQKIAFFAYKKLQKHSYSFFTNNFSGSLITKVKRFTVSFEKLYDDFLFSIFFGFIKITVYIISMLYFFPVIITIFYILWLISYMFLIKFLAKKQIPLDLDEANADSNVTSRLADNISNILNIKIFSNHKLELKQYNSLLKDQEIKRYKSWRFKNIQFLIQGLLFSILEICITYISLIEWSKGNITPGTIVLIQTYIIGSFGIIWSFSRSIIHIQKSLAEAQEMIDIFEIEPEIKDPKKPEQVCISKGSILFKEIGFVYKNNKKATFNKFNLQIKSKEKIGLVGHSGAGKSTIISLLLRFQDVTDGAIFIDNQDIRNINQDDLREKITYVPQEPILFHRSIYENISYGNINATKEQIIEVAKKAHAHSFISNLPNGYDTLVGERGVKLSGGERQRIAIARAMLKNSPILILDEATSALDSISEKHIQLAFAELMKDKTTIVIAHRLSTIQNMDRIIVLDNGKIIEEGTHNELISKNSGVYNNFWKSQSGEFLNE